MSDRLLTTIDQGMGRLERAFNIAGYIPLVSSISAPVRATIAKIELVASLFIGFYELISTGSFDHAINVTFTYASHGLANFFRALVEFIPFLGNLLCFLYDQMEGRYSYTYEYYPVRV